TCITILEGEDWCAQLLAIDCIKSMAKDAVDVVPSLRHLLTRPRPDLIDIFDDIRCEAVRAIRQIGVADADTISALSQMLCDESELLQREAAQTLGEFALANDQALQVLIDALNLDDERVQISAMDALSDLTCRASAALPVLQSLVATSAPDV